LLVGCAQSPGKEIESKPEPVQPLPALPATLINDPDCPGCLAVTLTLRPDGSYLVRDQLGASEFYDFGRWKYAEGTLELAGGREAPRRYQLKDLRQASQVEPLRGPFRMIGFYDGATFKECRTGLAWPLAQTRAADALQMEYTKRVEKPVLVALDAQFEGAPETLRVLRPASVLDARACPS
jgi:NlpE C-terminal OB domain